MYFFILFILVCFFIVVNLILSNMSPNTDKLSAYECGFDTLGDSRIKFDLFFYLIALLFLVFDLELILLFPLISSFSSIDGPYSIIVIFSFVVVLTVGYAYEWVTGAIKY